MEDATDRPFSTGREIVPYVDRTRPVMDDQAYENRCRLVGRTDTRESALERNFPQSMAMLADSGDSVNRSHSDPPPLNRHHEVVKRNARSWGPPQRSYQQRQADKRVFLALGGPTRRSETDEGIIRRSIFISGLRGSSEREIWHTIDRLSGGAVSDSRIECGGVNRYVDTQLMKRVPPRVLSLPMLPSTRPQPPPVVARPPVMMTPSSSSCPGESCLPTCGNALGTTRLERAPQR